MSGTTIRFCIMLIASGTAAMGVANADDKNQPPQIPTCDKKMGTLAVTEPENTWWTQYQLESPAALIKVFVSQSKCFTLVDRGKEATWLGGASRAMPWLRAGRNALAPISARDR